ncbi:hypothetical protein DLJ53_19325 [Acuticoccus sediminis]|uniref:HTH luxR-type domain-containing protein n=1 Tax=Acuticoccus sediminis TaxID=2184697 RepID=A0A8B2NJU2_9HYPH|nr:helix-turn-helix transcriptional regulator [Acuticoccus sediminis]RAH99894.1 hypothetical protein DLJ53_19325 [Acuticoccus sediminis]
MNVIPFPQKADFVAVAVPGYDGLDDGTGARGATGLAPGTPGRCGSIVARLMRGLLQCDAASARRLIATGLFAYGGPDGVRPVGAAVERRLADLAESQARGVRCNVVIGDVQAMLVVETFPDPDGAERHGLIVRPLVPAPWTTAALMDTFSVTQREADIALGLLAGLSINAIAKRFALRSTTVRQYLKSIYLKTGTSSQAQLVALLNGAFADARTGEWPVREDDLSETGR